MIYEKMNKLENKRLQTAIAYFSKYHYKKTKRLPTQTQIYKFLAFADFFSVRKRGKPIFGLRYIAMKNGPVPVELYEETRSIKTTKQYDFYKVVPEENKRYFAYIENRPLKLEYFAKKELEILNEVMEILVDRELTTYHYSEATHQKLKAWKTAYKNNPNSPMNYEDEIEDEELKDILEGYEAVQKIKRG